MLAITFVARRADHGEAGIAFVISAFSHSLVDALPSLWGGTESHFLLWPVLAVEPYDSSGAPTVLGLLQESLGEPYFLVQVSFAALALIYWRQDGYPGLALLRRLVGRVIAISSRPDT
nr:hypothetical protein [Natrinema sp. 1APR25-10V2]